MRYQARQPVMDCFGAGSWQRVLFDEFSTVLLNERRLFPCIFGVNGFRADQLRFLFVNSLEEIHCLGNALGHFVQHSRSYGPNTSLVVFTKPEPVQPLDIYRHRLWTTLNELACIDGAAWPENIPQEIDNAHWEFCFRGEPIFVVCNTPAHVARQSRRASSFMLTFQPRWIFDQLLHTSKAAETAFGKVRERLKVFDLISLSPDLGLYGSAGTREYRQYFLEDENKVASCPFRRLGKPQGQAV